MLHPSWVVRFRGNPWPDPSLAPTPWSDSVLQSLYDAVHAEAPTLPKVDPSLLEPTSGAQTEKNKLAQSRDPRIRSDLADTWINDDGTIRWPPDNGADGPETAVPLLPGQIVDKYGDVGGSYLAPAGSPFAGRSLPYDKARTPLRSFRVLKPFTVQSSRVASWFDQPGGAIQFRTEIDISDLVKQEYINGY